MTNDEIEALEKRLRAVGTTFYKQMADAIAQLRAEVERLTRERDEWRIAPGDEPAKMRAAIRAAILADRADSARIIRAHLCVPWRIDGTRDDEAAAAANEIIERLAQAILARASE